MGKRIICWAFLVCLLLSGCGAAGTADGTAAAEPEIQTETQMAPVQEQETGELVMEQVQDASRCLVDEEILNAYQRAEKIYSWFEISPLPAGAGSRSVDGRTYWPVDYPGMETMGDLRAYLRSVFSEELTEKLLATGGDTPLYLELEGKLYVTSGGRERDKFKGSLMTQVEQMGDTSYFVNAAVDLLDTDGSTVTGVECASFPYELVDGEWVFTDFWLLY